MPRHDPIPPKLDRAARAWARYKRLTQRIAIAAIAAVLLSLVYLRSEGRAVPVDMMIAILAGVGLAVLLGTALMGLVFLGNASGRDAAASAKEESDDRHQA